jgi:hypothetical protein
MRELSEKYYTKCMKMCVRYLAHFSSMKAAVAVIRAHVGGEQQEMREIRISCMAGRGTVTDERNVRALAR